MSVLYIHPILLRNSGINSFARLSVRLTFQSERVPFHCPDECGRHVLLSLPHLLHGHLVTVKAHCTCDVSAVRSFLVERFAEFELDFRVFEGGLAAHGDGVTVLREYDVWLQLAGSR